MALEIRLADDALNPPFVPPAFQLGHAGVRIKRWSRGRRPCTRRSHPLGQGDQIDARSAEADRLIHLQAGRAKATWSTRVVRRPVFAVMLLNPLATRARSGVAPSLNWPENNSAFPLITVRGVFRSCEIAARKRIPLPDGSPESVQRIVASVRWPRARNRSASTSEVYAWPRFPVANSSSCWAAFNSRHDRRENGSEGGGDHQKQGAEREPEAPARRKRGEQEKRAGEHDNQERDSQQRRSSAASRSRRQHDAVRLGIDVRQTDRESIPRLASREDANMQLAVKTCSRWRGVIS